MILITDPESFGVLVENIQERTEVFIRFKELGYDQLNIPGKKIPWSPATMSVGLVTTRDVTVEIARKTYRRKDGVLGNACYVYSRPCALNILEFLEENIVIL